MVDRQIRVGYVELTKEESASLMDAVKQDKNIENYDELQLLMNDYESRLLEPERDGILPEELAGENTPGVEGLDQEMIEIFPKLEGGKTYLIKASKK